MRQVVIEVPTDPHSAYSSIYSDDQTPSGLESCFTLRQLFKTAVKNYGEKASLGQRKILAKIRDQDHGKIKIQKDLENEYEYISYDEASKIVDSFASGLSCLEVKASDKLSIMMETRMEWFISSAAAHKLGAVVATIYANLGTIGVVHSLNELESQVLIISNELLPLISEVRPQLSSLKKVVVVQDKVAGRDEPLLVDKIPGLDIISFSDLLTRGQSMPPIQDYPTKTEDIAVIMYTSGSTGTPKGVLLPHESVIAILHHLTLEMIDFVKSKENSGHVSYLPMAHIFEFVMVHFSFHLGVPVGFSSPLTVMDNPAAFITPSANVTDIELIKPSLMVAVPLTLDKIRNKVKETMSKFGVTYEEDGIPEIVQHLFLNKMGGKLERILCGGALLSESTQRFIVELGLQVYAIYGSTETAGLGTLSTLNDHKYGSVGIPNGSLIRLVDWEEGGYKVTDQPCARGEIMISGKISYGYFKNEEVTKENFVTDAEGRRWWKSGDIGSVDPTGYFNIIDRKKDLVKPPKGEYISPAGIEAFLKSSAFVANVCVCARSQHNSVVALILPNRPALEGLASLLGIEKETAFEQLCTNKVIVDQVRKDLLLAMKDSNLSSIEKPRKIKLCTEDWTPESGLVTAAMKIRRKQINDFYKVELDALFSEVENDKFVDLNANHRG
jgi:long-chain acyl-CoA synthetase